MAKIGGVTIFWTFFENIYEKLLEKLLKNSLNFWKILENYRDFRKILENFRKSLSKKTEFSIIEWGSPPDPPARDTPAWNSTGQIDIMELRHNGHTYHQGENNHFDSTLH